LKYLDQDADYRLTMDVFKASHRVDTAGGAGRAKCGWKHGIGVGLSLTFPMMKGKKYVLFTSDTSWNLRVEEQYRKLLGKIDVAVVHLSSLGNELNWLFTGARTEDYVHPQHLGLIGTIRFIDTTRPKTIVLGEKCAELNEVWPSLASVIAEACELPPESVVAADIGTTVSLA